MALSIKNIFGRKDAPTTPTSNIVGVTPTGNPVVAQDVNWKQQGFVDAGAARGNINAFQAGFTATLQSIKQSQQLDQELQDQLKSELNAEKINLEGELKVAQNRGESERQKLDAAKQKVADLQRQLNEARHGMVNQEKSLRLNFLIGVSIVALLTIYLFIFYSSTAYSAFFRDFDAGDSLNVAMFDGNAIIDAFRFSFFEGCFCLFMPVIFLALGYVAHNFNTSTKGVVKYLKVALLYLITFAFDFLLAYKISKAFYEIEAAASLVPLPPYSVKLAFAQEDFWIVIFCGFVSYVIWGLAFSFVMNCYDRLTNSKYALEGIENQLQEAQTAVTNCQNALADIDKKIAQLEADIKKKAQELQSNVRYNYATLKQALANYYNGWVTYLSNANIPANPLHASYNQEMNAVDEWMKQE